MARAGDGQPRSNRRRSTAMISLRVTERERATARRLAEAQGYDSVSAWIRDRVLHGDATPQAQARVVGSLGRIGGWLNEAAQALEAAGAAPEAQLYRGRSGEVAAMQRRFLGQDAELIEDDDAG
ncbi:plasmid mobilization protein [Paracoccus jeotgali]|nr:hypothetical protein [Paracoccus jeotgali]